MDAPETRILLIVTSSFGAVVVEALEEIRKSGARRLRVETAVGPSVGLDRLETLDADVVLFEMDTQEPRAGRAVSTLCANALFVPVVVLSAADCMDDAVAAVRAGAQEFLSRSELSPDRMLRAIDCAIARTSSAQESTGPGERVRAGPWLFGQFMLDDAKLVLRERSKIVDIHLTPLRLLIYLIRNSDRPVSKQELLETVWDGADVGDYAVSSALKDLRQALHDDGSRQRWIRTVRGNGYRFIGQIESHPILGRASPPGAASRSSR